MLCKLDAQRLLGALQSLQQPRAHQIENPGLRPWVLLFPPFADGFGVNARCPGTVGFAAAWVGSLPCFNLGLLGAAANGSAAAIFFAIFVFLKFTQAV